ncbi:hypothetical protein RhiJN_23584 [Ceratobasidium sp. AG-Ba]|nr:hypothetical protein RhiJN_23584 [Ceratobasidium sp. AG-Ba]
MTAGLVLDAIPSELQLHILRQLKTRVVLVCVARLNKYWFDLASELVRQRAVSVLGRPGVVLAFETSDPADYRSRTTYTLQCGSSLFEPTLECASLFALPKLSLGFPSDAPTFNFSLDEDEYFGSLLWAVLLTTQRMVKCRVSPPASPKLVAFDRSTTHYQRVSEGLDRFRRNEFTSGSTDKGEERLLTGDVGPGANLRARLEGEGSEVGEQGRVVEAAARRTFKVGLEGIKLDAASVVIASEENTRGDDMTVLFCGR